MRWMTIFWVMLSLSGPALACGPDSDCVVGDRIYRISFPEGHLTGTPIGALVWSHGYRGSAAGVMRNGSLRRMVHEKGLALIAAQGVGGTWDLPNGPRRPESTGASEFAYFGAVVEDAAARFGIDTDRMIAAGFSAGGMVVWNLACNRPGLFAGFIPVSGTYWLRPPERCADPVASLVHIHGDADTTVPLDGRRIGPTKQGRVTEALAHYAKHGGFGAPQERTEGALRCRERANGAGKILEFCLFEGGHSFRTEFLSHGIERLRNTGNL